MTTSNKNIILIVGKPCTGKTASLRNLPNQDKIAYLNTDLKELSYASKMQQLYINDPRDILFAIDEIEASSEINSGILDTLSFLMTQYETQYVNNSSNTQKAWGEYANFYKQFIHKIKSGTKDYIIMSHAQDIMNESEMVVETKAFVKGSIGKLGVEADFSIVLGTRKVPVKLLKGMENDLLHITEEEIEDGYKYCFQTRVDKDTMGWTMRAPIGLWNRNEKFIDNDISQVLTKVKQYYAS
jgi:hypothetical protein